MVLCRKADIKIDTGTSHYATVMYQVNYFLGLITNVTLSDSILLVTSVN